MKRCVRSPGQDYALPRMNISPYTLRFYDKEGLFPDLTKSSNGRRYFSLNDLQWVYIIQCFRESGMPLAEIREYVKSAKEGTPQYRLATNLLIGCALRKATVRKTHFFVHRRVVGLGKNRALICFVFFANPLTLCAGFFVV